MKRARLAAHGLRAISLWPALAYLCIALGILSAQASSARAETFTTKVIAVLDGDTVLVAQSGKRPTKIRLAGIDAPEKAQAFGAKSRQALVELVLNREVRVETVATDKFGRRVAQLIRDGSNVNQQQVRSGMAWEYSYFHRDREYAALQREAQQAQLGLWSQPNPIPPWEWRKTHPSAAAAPRGKSLDTEVSDFNCGRKQHCSQMRSCDEAHYFLSHCGLSSLDQDGDGIPCPARCLPQGTRRVGHDSRQQ